MVAARADGGLCARLWRNAVRWRKRDLTKACVGVGFTVSTPALKIRAKVGSGGRIPAGDEVFVVTPTAYWGRDRASKKDSQRVCPYGVSGKPGSVRSAKRT